MKPTAIACVLFAGLCMQVSADEFPGSRHFLIQPLGIKWFIHSENTSSDNLVDQPYLVFRTMRIRDFQVGGEPLWRGTRIAVPYRAMEVRGWDSEYVVLSVRDDEKLRKNLMVLNAGHRLENALCLESYTKAVLYVPKDALKQWQDYLANVQKETDPRRLPE